MTPFGSKKCVIPEIGAALISGGANFLGDLLGLSSQDSANKANLKMTRETNEMNYKIANETNQMSQAQFNKNLEWLREQYYDTDQYRRTVEAAKKAGLNPALALGSVSPVGSVGQASPTSFHAAQMEAGHVDPLSFDAIGEGVGAAANAYFDNQLKQSQSENINADTKTKDISNMTQFARDLAALHNLWEDIENKKSQRGLTDAQKKHYDMMSEELDGKIKLFWTQFDSLSDAPKKSNRLLDAQYDETESRTALNKIEAQFRPLLLRSNLHLNNSQAQQLLALAGNLWEQAKSEYKNRHEIMPLEVIQRKLANGISGILFNSSKSYEDFIKDENMSDYRNFIKTFGELLFRLK